VKIRIVKQLIGVVEGVALHHYRPGHTYDVTPTLANYLVAEGFATFELRHSDAGPSQTPERRKKRG
jgi:hypothetical protein